MHLDGRGRWLNYMRFPAGGKIVQRCLISLILFDKPLECWRIKRKKWKNARSARTLLYKKLYEYSEYFNLAPTAYPLALL